MHKIASIAERLKRTPPDATASKVGGSAIKHATEHPRQVEGRPGLSDVIGLRVGLLETTSNLSERMQISLPTSGNRGVSAVLSQEFIAEKKPGKRGQTNGTELLSHLIFAGGSLYGLVSRFDDEGNRTQTGVTLLPVGAQVHERPRRSRLVWDVADTTEGQRQMVFGAHDSDTDKTMSGFEFSLTTQTGPNGDEITLDRSLSGEGVAVVDWGEYARCEAATNETLHRVSTMVESLGREPQAWMLGFATRAK